MKKETEEGLYQLERQKKREKKKKKKKKEEEKGDMKRTVLVCGQLLHPPQRGLKRFESM